jgi:hypothetical protein
MKEIARWENGTSRIQSAVAHIFSVYHVMKLGNLNKHFTQLILGFGKDITLFVNLEYHSNCYQSTFGEFTGTITSYIEISR